MTYSQYFDVRVFVITLAINIFLGFGTGYLTTPMHTKGQDVSYPYKAADTPPGYVFGLVWTSIYVGTAFVRSVACLEQDVARKNQFNRLFNLQLIVQNVWPLLFFVFKLYAISLANILQLIAILIVAYFYLPRSNARIVTYACHLVWVGYLGWLMIAAHLNYESVLLAQSAGHSDAFTPVADICSNTRMGQWIAMAQPYVSQFSWLTCNQPSLIDPAF